MSFRENTIKIVSTLGPASSSKQMIKALIDAGVDVFRLNFSHGTHDEKRDLVKKIREASNNVAIMADIQGPKIRVGNMKNKQTYNLNVGQEVKVFEKEMEGDNTQFSVPLPGFIKSLKKGDFFFINDGIIKVQVKSKEKEFLIGEVITGGVISSHKGVNIPMGELKQRVPTEQDIKDLELIAELDVEYVSISFVMEADDVLHVRKILENYGNNTIKLISKIERPIALENFDEILEVSDGVMVARGDLAIELDFNLVPIWQKRMIYKCNKEGKPIITATQMLESMISNSVPTRAEAADIFNAVLDGTDAVMLSAETAAGQYPVESVKVMNKIAVTANQQMAERVPDKYDSDKLTHTQVLGHSIYALSKEMEELNFRGKILVITRGGIGARMIAKYRPPLPIIAITPNQKTARELSLVWGVQPYFMNNPDFFNQDVEKIIEQAVRYAVEQKAVYENEHVIILLVSRKFEKKGNLVGFYYVGEILESGAANSNNP